MTGCSQVSLCLGASVPEEHQVASLFAISFCYYETSFRCLQHNTMYVIVIKSFIKEQVYIYSCRYVFYPSDVLEYFENDP